VVSGDGFAVSVAVLSIKAAEPTTSHYARFYRGGARRQNRTASSPQAGPLHYGKALKKRF